MSRSCGCSRARWSSASAAEQRICSQGDVVVIPGGTEHEAWFREDTEVIDFFAPPRDDFLFAPRLANPVLILRLLALDCGILTFGGTVARSLQSS